MFVVISRFYADKKVGVNIERINDREDTRSQLIKRNGYKEYFDIFMEKEEAENYKNMIFAEMPKGWEIIGEG